VPDRRTPTSGWGAPRWPVATAASAVLVAVAAAGCSGPGTKEAADTAVSFEQLVVAAPDQACQLLSGHTRERVEKEAKASCAEALPQQDLPAASTVQSVDVYGHDAMVLLDGDVVFLARFDEGWKVTAAGCNPGSQPDEPFDCDVSGG
jgi:hypothetical protein